MCSINAKAKTIKVPHRVYMHLEEAISNASCRDAIYSWEHGDLHSAGYTATAKKLVPPIGIPSSYPAKIKRWPWLCPFVAALIWTLGIQ